MYDAQFIEAVSEWLGATNCIIAKKRTAPVIKSWFGGKYSSRLVLKDEKFTKKSGPVNNHDQKNGFSDRLLGLPRPLHKSLKSLLNDGVIDVEVKQLPREHADEYQSWQEKRHCTAVKSPDRVRDRGREDEREFDEKAHTDPAHRAAFVKAQPAHIWPPRSKRHAFAV